MRARADDGFPTLLTWCASVLGPFEMLSDESRVHVGHASGVYRLRRESGRCCLKVHEDASHWECEVHGYEQWAPVFGEHVPKLIAVREEQPLALIVTELPGTILEKVRLAPSQERDVWFAAGEALATLHGMAEGPYFGPCHRDGSCVQGPVTAATEYVSGSLDAWVQRGMCAGCLTADELATIQAARELVPAFAGERPLPCHRDYCPANWLVSDEGAWVGVIDFEFSHWDVRAADLTRYPDWDWIERPGMVEALLAGYGRSFTAAEEQQRLVAHAQYALSAIVWGQESAFYGFKAEGQQALRRLAPLLR